MHHSVEDTITGQAPAQSNDADTGIVGSYRAVETFSLILDEHN